MSIVQVTSFGYKRFFKYSASPHIHCLEHRRRQVYRSGVDSRRSRVGNGCGGREGEISGTSTNGHFGNNVWKRKRVRVILILPPLKLVGSASISGTPPVKSGVDIVVDMFTRVQTLVTLLVSNNTDRQTQCHEIVWLPATTIHRIVILLAVA